MGRIQNSLFWMVAILNFCFLLVFNQTLEPVACSIKVMVSVHIYLRSMLTIMIICREIDTSLSDVYGHVLWWPGLDPPMWCRVPSEVFVVFGPYFLFIYIFSQFYHIVKLWPWTKHKPETFFSPPQLRNSYCLKHFFKYFKSCR